MSEELVEPVFELTLELEECGALELKDVGNCLVLSPTFN